MNKRLIVLLSALIVASLLLYGCSRTKTVETSLINVKGSDTMVNLMSAFAETYMQIHPNTQISVTGGGSGTGISALINGTTEICASSRNWKDNETQLAQSKGIQPTELVVGMDGLAVIVHPTNPTTELTLEQVSKIYTGQYTRWSDVGGPDKPIVVLSRESNSGTYVYFQEHVLNKADFANTVRLMPSSGAIIQALKDDQWAIGYAGVAYGENSGVKILKIKKSADSAPVFPNEAAVHDGSYPISRPLLLYTNGKPSGEIKNFMEWCLTPEGQKIVVETGYMTVKKG